MKKILLISVAILLLQEAASADAAFSNANLHGNFGYKFLGHAGTQVNDFVVEVGVLEADGHGGIKAFGTRVFTPPELPQETIEVTYDCSYNIEPKGIGRADCLLTENGQNQLNMSFRLVLDNNCHYLIPCNEIRFISLPIEGEGAPIIAVIGSAYMQNFNFAYV